MTNIGFLERMDTSEHSDTAHLRQKPLYLLIADRLRSMVLQSELKPESRVQEQQLCDLFGVSRTPLREALKVLAGEGLVELLPNRGARITPIDPIEMLEVFEVMGALAALSGELIVQRASDADIAYLLSLHEQMLGHQRNGDRANYFKVNQEVHGILSRLADNRVLQDLEAQLNIKIVRARYAANFSDDRWAESAKEHEVIMRALKQRDGAAVSNAMRAHMRKTGEAVIAGLRTKN